MCLASNGHEDGGLAVPLWLLFITERSMPPASDIFSTSLENDMGLMKFLSLKSRLEESSLVDILQDMMIVRQRLALAEHASTCIQQHPFNDVLDYTRLELPIRQRSYFEFAYRLEPPQIQLFALAAKHHHPMLPLHTHAPTLTHIVAYHNTQNTPLYQQVAAYTPRTRPTNTRYTISVFRSPGY